MLRLAQARVTKSKPPAAFFQPRARRDITRQDYTSLQRREIVPTNPRRDPSTPTPSTTSTTPEDNDTIIVDPLAPMDEDEDDEMPDIDTPTFDDTGLTDEEKLQAVHKWRIHREKHERKPRDKTSHVYFYMQKRLLAGCLFSEYTGGPNILQEYRWSCNICYGLDRAKYNKKYNVLESKRKGVTTGMGDHLKTHGITKDTHNARKAGYVKVSHNNPDTTWSGSTDLLVARLTPRESMRRWFVKSRQAFLEVETLEFQEMFYSVGVASLYRSRLTLRNGIFDDFLFRRVGLT